MAQVEDLREVRADGVSLPEFGWKEKFEELGLEPLEIVKVEWRYGNKTVQVEDSRYLDCKVLPDRSGVAFMLPTAVASDDILAVVNADGTPRFSYGSIHVFGETRVAVRYQWFENARTDPNRDIGVVCDAKSLSGPPLVGRNLLFDHLDIDPDDGRIVGHSTTG